MFSCLLQLEWPSLVQKGFQSHCPVSYTHLYECGDNNHLLVVVLDKIHHVGYRDLDDAVVKETVKAEVQIGRAHV